MATVGIFYATRHGHARRVAQHVAEYFRTRDFDVDVWSVLNAPENLDPGKYRAIVVVASVHVGSHEPEMIRFVKRHRRALGESNNAFVTISLCQAGVERTDATADQRAKWEADVARMTQRFVTRTGWQPQRVQPVAGALLYTKYNPLLRLVMKWIASKAGKSTNTSRDHVYTDWAALNGSPRALRTSSGPNRRCLCFWCAARTPRSGRRPQCPPKRRRSRWMARSRRPRARVPR
jgi:menaquinone-dependent protoporphyrinogen oxidase